MIYKIKKFFTVIISVLLLLTCSGLIIGLIVKKQDKPTNKVDYYTVTFDVGEFGVKSIEPQKIEIGSKPILYTPECAVKTAASVLDFDFDVTQLGENMLPLMRFEFIDDYEFVGWYYDGAQITEESVYAFNKDVTLIAKWRSLWTKNY